VINPVEEDNQMRNKKLALVSVLAMTVLAGTGCSMLSPEKTSTPSNSSQGALQGDMTTNVMPTTVYVGDPNGFVVPLNIKMAETKEVAKATLEQMVRGSKGDAALVGTGLKNVLPEGTAIRGIAPNGDTVTVDFSKEVMNYKTEQEEQMIVDSVVWTLTGMGDFKKVKFLIDGRQQPTLKLGTPIADAISRANGINLQVAQNVMPSNTTKLTLYFTGANSSGDFTYLVPVTRLISKVKDANLVDLTLAELAKGPSVPGLNEVMASTLQLPKSELKDKVAKLDFGDDFQGVGATNAGKNMINSIVLSVAANAGVNQIQFTVDGKAPKTVAKDLDLSNPVSLPQTINEQKL
jgi:germination protein M